MRDDVVGGDRLPAVRAGHGRGEEFPAGPMLETHRGSLLRRHPAIAPGNADPGVSPYTLIQLSGSVSGKGGE